MVLELPYIQEELKDGQVEQGRLGIDHGEVSLIRVKVKVQNQIRNKNKG